MVENINVWFVVSRARLKYQKVRVRLRFATLLSCILVRISIALGIDAVSH